MKLDLVDVFGSGPLSGNPLGVVHGADDMTAEQMLRLTQWLGFSETTFLLPPTDPAADYRVRIFYPGGELPFAGHPTLGSCHAWLEMGSTPKRGDVIVQECGVGLVEVKRDGDRLAFRAPEFTRYGPMTEDERAEAIRLTGVDPDAVVEAVHVSNGPEWQLLRLRSDADVLAADPAPKAPLGTDIGLAGPGGEGSPVDWEIRAFFSDTVGRFREDPVTGSFNAGVALHLFRSGLALSAYRAAQGRKIGADGLIICEDDGAGSAWIGGTSTTVSSQGLLPEFA
ncbi:PhzF family phenazine biosynthesis protein [Altererythrobacter arenosus]|uniref:PhzF family phenazine biosynthesis protein n=1 Tax=Altererythrobacter arenosus TaxID=3032592 RepID=A0ABY8FNX7_9SPHN|nr:PhzF family phenazine biosynthesis protein [Altererythrobacter sp. CAU 1644]WFL76722.1 PhzF family phenazine biosynthesis protein [Altererythrobacter sp. CAU 1644]